MWSDMRKEDIFSGQVNQQRAVTVQVDVAD